MARYGKKAQTQGQARDARDETRQAQERPLGQARDEAASRRSRSVCRRRARPAARCRAGARAGRARAPEPGAQRERHRREARAESCRRRRGRVVAERRRRRYRDRIARAAGLVYVSDRDPGFRRVRRGKGFRYLRADGRPLRRDDGTPEAHRESRHSARIRARLDLPQPRGHMQATGRDARGASNTAITPTGGAPRDGHKFERIVGSAPRCPKLRERLQARTWHSQGCRARRCCAVVISLLDTTRARIGNAEYARDNRSYGLTTLRNRHVQFLRGGAARLTFRGKGGLEHDIVVDDARLVRIVRRCQELPVSSCFSTSTTPARAVRSPRDSSTTISRETHGHRLHREGLPHVGGDPARDRAARGDAVAGSAQRRGISTRGHGDLQARRRGTSATRRRSAASHTSARSAFEAWRSGALHRSLGGNRRLTLGATCRATRAQAAS